MTSVRFSGAFTQIPIAMNAKPGALSLEQYKGIVDHLDGAMRQYSGYSSHYHNEFQAVVYEKDHALYGGIATNDHYSEKLLAEQLLGKNKSWAGDTEPVQAPFVYTPGTSGQVSDYVKGDGQWEFLSRAHYDDKQNDSVMAVMRRLHELG